LCAIIEVGSSRVEIPTNQPERVNPGGRTMEKKLADRLVLGSRNIDQMRRDISQLLGILRLPMHHIFWSRKEKKISWFFRGEGGAHDFIWRMKEEDQKRDAITITLHHVGLPNNFLLPINLFKPETIDIMSVEIVYDGLRLLVDKIGEEEPQLLEPTRQYGWHQLVKAAERQL
jgi:hypothetical protein